MITKVLDLFYLKTYDHDEHVSRMCREQGFWEPDVTEWMRKNVESGWTCLDVGSNIGYFTELLCRISGPDGFVHSFEPNPNVFYDYKNVRELNDYTNCSEVKLHKFGLSDKNKKEILIVPDWNIGGASIKFNDSDAPKEWERIEIELKRYDDLDISDLSVDFIKMDIEGSEPEAFDGMSSALETCPLILMEIGPYHPINFLERISDEYKIFLIEINKETEIDIGRILSASHHLNVVLRKK